MPRNLHIAQPIGGTSVELKTPKAQMGLMDQDPYATFRFDRPLLPSVVSVISSWKLAIDAAVAACLFPAAVALLISGLDDLALDLVCLWAWFMRRVRGPGHRSGPSQPVAPASEKRIAIFVPLW